MESILIGVGIYLGGSLPAALLAMTSAWQPRKTLVKNFFIAWIFWLPGLIYLQYKLDNDAL